MNTGNMSRARTVIFQLNINMARRVTPTLMALPMTELKVSVKACWAPSTSLLSREIKAPVWVRVKKAMGMRWMWLNTRFRMSNMRLSPTRDEIQRSHNPSMASKTARAPMANASHSTTPVVGRWPGSSLMMALVRRGFAAPTRASMMMRTRNTASILR